MTASNGTGGGAGRDTSSGTSGLAPLRSVGAWDGLLEAKANTGHTISVCLPARDEETTIGHIVGTVRRDLMEHVALVDELIVIDDGSTDDTAAAARDEGATVVAQTSILPNLERGAGKGNALWKSLQVSRGDIVCWVDADIRNFCSKFVTRLVAPLLEAPDVQFVKAHYQRPYHAEPTGGGRVTELMARPLLSHLFPMLADIVQPLAGEYAGRRRALEQVPFVQGWGVELGLLVDICERFGRDAIAQVDLGVREHRNRPLAELGAPALAILVTALRRAGLEQSSPGVVQLLGFDDDALPRTLDVITAERPPIITIADYRATRAASKAASSHSSAARA
jgi:glucosyl-3-phosphoglycerate synthase